MSEKRGYPNPNYTEEDIREGIPLEMNAEILIDDKEYRELVSKAAALDILTARIRSAGKIEEEVVYAITGTSDGQQMTEAKKFENWWHEECSVTRKLREQVAQLERARTELTEILKQNKIGPFAEDQENAEEKSDE